MTDNEMKLGEAEVIKALECCVECDTFGGECREDCPFKDVDDCTFVFKRQRDEIERLEEVISKTETTIKSEAIKEFAQRLKTKLQWDVEYENKLVFENDIDNLVKEMTEDNNAT